MFGRAGFGEREDPRRSKSEHTDEFTYEKLGLLFYLSSAVP